MNLVDLMAPVGAPANRAGPAMPAQASPDMEFDGLPPEVQARILALLEGGQTAQPGLTDMLVRP